MRKSTFMMLVAAAIGSAATARAQDAKWAEKIAFKGDVRARYETIDEEGKEERERARVRARLLAEAKVNDTVKAGVGLSTTENGDPVSSNQTLDGGASRKQAYFDLVYIDYLSPGGLGATAGKMKMPFVTVRDMIWDTDLNPEGVAAKYGIKNDLLEVSANAADFIMDERAEDSDTSVYGGQLVAKVKAAEAFSITVGGSDYFYENIEGESVMDFATTDPTKVKSFGNQTTKTTEVGDDGEETVTGVFYKYGFNLVEGFVMVDMDVGIPLGVYGDFVVNTEADEEDTGYMLGFMVGRTKDPGSFQFDYNYRDVEANAVVGAFSDSDSFGGGTDGEGHRVSGSYQVAKNVTGTVTYFMDDKSVTKGGIDYDRLQIDLVAKF